MLPTFAPGASRRLDRLTEEDQTLKDRDAMWWTGAVVTVVAYVGLVAVLIGQIWRG